MQDEQYCLIGQCVDVDVGISLVLLCCLVQCIEYQQLIDGCWVGLFVGGMQVFDYVCLDVFVLVFECDDVFLCLCIE